MSQVAPQPRALDRDNAPTRTRPSRPSAYQVLLGELPPHNMGHRYSVEKGRRFGEYSRTASTVRKIGMLLVTPLSGLLASLLVVAIPLQDPALGTLRNPGLWAQAAVITWLAMISAMVGSRAAVSIDHSEYSIGAITIIATIATALHGGAVFGLTLLWRFPLPFSWVVGLVPYAIALAIGHEIVLRSRHKELRDKLRASEPAFLVQISQISIYAAYSSAFQNSNDWQRIALVAFFPVLKLALKRTILRLAKHMKDHACESAVAGVEVCASMYQAMVVQSTPSPIVSACIIGVDVLVGVIDIRRMLHHDTVVPSREIVAKAIHTLQNPSQKINEERLPPVRTRSTVRGSRARASPSASIIPSPSSQRNKDRLALAQALEILQSMETVLLVEYLEVVVPVVNAIHALVASQVASAIYDPKLCMFYHQPRELRAALANILLYSALQGVTLVGLSVAVRIRYGVSALTLLAFVLEFHAWSLHAKMVCWMPLMFSFSVIHYGVDFTFRFDLTVRPQK